ncbi:uncharacterized protein FA14DRAFT_127241 [Meira miltonrushii]|uniref:Uncharacterized protein n=1 Tax=Meira miltonrushii TaxID=1280837 RepID=A0A316V5A8_9BASI|nr:uncharacterized protein FA14DRAFT_127241 [Meira miltonrushii]PWN32208.1 hypothetical protein FA14DRAFT_127241 [Meira miltonrushii]
MFNNVASDTVAFLLQRLPFVAHVGMLVLSAIGPFFAPHMLAFCVVFTHIVFFVCQSRTAYGIYRAWVGVRAHSQRDWVEYFEHERASLEACDRAQHILPLEDVQHVIILPAYKEEMATLRETLDVLASHPLAKTMYHVCLGMEEREDGAAIKAQMLSDAYRAKGRFADITYSIHPGNIVGESAGKSSNVNWAARHMAHRRGISSLRGIYTVMDADTAFASDFFLASAVHFSLATPAIRRRMMFVPPTLFDRNGREVPVFTRVTDIFWSCAGIGGIYPSSSVKIPTSAYGTSMELARFCDFWDAGPEAIGEDLHYYCKAMFETKGNVHAVTIYSPASQMNVVGKGGSNSVTNYVNDMNARWTQAVRHMWGSLDFGYCWHRIIMGRFGRSAPHAATSSRTPSPSVTATTDATDDTDITHINLHTPNRKITQFDSMQYAQSKHLPTLNVKGIDDTTRAHATLLSSTDGEEIESQVQDAYDEQSDAEKLRIFPLIVLMTRLYEAHLMIAQVTLYGFFLAIYPSVIYRNADTPPGLQPSWMMPTILMCATKAAHLFGGMGIAATVLMCIFHDCYHAAATRRWASSDQLYLPSRYLGTRPYQNFARAWPAALLDFCAVPAAIMYGLAPLLWAQMNHVFTNKLTYTVSAKSKSIVIVPTIHGSRASLDRIRGQSVELSRLMTDEKSVRN